MLWINKLYLQIWRLMINCSSPAATNDPSHDREEPADWLLSLSSPLPRFDLTCSHIMCRRRVVVVLMVTTVTAACAKAAVRGVAVILACLWVRRVQWSAPLSLLGAAGWSQQDVNIAFTELQMLNVTPGGRPAGTKQKRTDRTDPAAANGSQSGRWACLTPAKSLGFCSRGIELCVGVPVTALSIAPKPLPCVK